jgi:hypothetical protein
MNTALEYSTRVVQEGGRRCKKSTLNDLVHLTPLRNKNTFNEPATCTVFMTVEPPSWNFGCQTQNIEIKMCVIYYITTQIRRKVLFTSINLSMSHCRTQLITLNDWANERRSINRFSHLSQAPLLRKYVPWQDGSPFKNPGPEDVFQGIVRLLVRMPIMLGAAFYYLVVF